MRSTAAERGPSMVMLIAAFAAVYLIWGSTYLGIKIAIETLPPLLMAGARFMLAGALVYAWARWRRAAAPTRSNWIAATIVGGFLLLGGNGLICWAQQYVPSGLTALLVATVPMWMVVLDWAVFRGPRPTLIIIMGLAVGLLGMFVLVNPASFIGEPIHTVGAITILAACILWAVGSLYARRAPLPSSGLLTIGMEMLAGGTLLTLAGLLRGEWSDVNLEAMSWQSAAAFFYLIVFGSLIGFSAYIWLLRTVSPAAVSTYAYVNPVVAVLLGWGLANEPMGLRTIIAAGLIIAAVVLITTRRNKTPATSSFDSDAAPSHANPQPDHDVAVIHDASPASTPAPAPVLVCHENPSSMSLQSDE